MYGCEILHKLIRDLPHYYHYLQVSFYHPKWCRISLAHPQYMVFFHPGNYTSTSTVNHRLSTRWTQESTPFFRVYWVYWLVLLNDKSPGKLGTVYSGTYWILLVHGVFTWYDTCAAICRLSPISSLLAHHWWLSLAKSHSSSQFK